MNLLYRVLTTLLWPLVALGIVLHPRTRKHAMERLGRFRPEVQPGAVWIHAASMGEGRAAQALISALRVQSPGMEVLRTCTSDVARPQKIGADQTTCLPIDVPVVMAAWLDRVRPRCAILVEAEIWPGLLWACRRRGIPVAIVGARVGARTRALFSLWPGLKKDITWLPADASTAAEVGGEPIGDLKRDAARAAPVLTWPHATSIVAGSTRDGDEVALLDAVARMDPRPLLVLAPRDPARFEPIADLLSDRHERHARRTRIVGAVPASLDVVLLDTMGELGGLYAQATAAFVGGTFDAAIGGHSPSEAASAACPVVYGPHTGANPAAWVGVAGVPAETVDGLAEAFAAAFSTPRLAPASTAGPGAAAIAAEALAAWTRRPIPAEHPLRPWLYPLAPLWRLAVLARPRPLEKAPVPVISVGGITAGGSGKTPVAAWFAERLADRDPVVVSRGYRRRRGSDVRLAGEALDVGDELAMLARRGVRIASSPDRLAGIRAAVEKGARLAILDDGLQVGAVARDLEVIVLDARWPRGGGPIPVGTARVPIQWLSRADVVWMNHGALPRSLARFVRPDAVVVEAHYRPVGWTYRGKSYPFSALPARPVMALAAIARPEGFFRLLRSYGVHPETTCVYPDHHAFVWADLQGIEAWLDDHVVVTTEKDAARLPPDSGVWALRIALDIVSGREALDEVLERL